jgi:type I restriction enzyme S subunit
MPDTGERMITGVDCTIIRFDPARVIPRFFILYSQSDAYLKSVDSKTTGTTRNRISRSNLGGVVVPVPAAAVQQRVVEEVDTLSVETQRLESIYQRKLDALDALKQSLLHHAFSGQL